MRIAHELGKLEPEILNMAPDEFARWVEYFKMVDKQRSSASRGQRLNA
jgi:hypothetical protein